MAGIFSLRPIQNRKLRAGFVSKSTTETIQFLGDIAAQPS
jgi:hypothetical protein